LRRKALLATVLALACGAAAAVAASASRDPDRAALSEAFQRMVGGLGLGPAVDLARCAHDFDPRLDPACPGDFEPLPGAARFCPHHPPMLPLR
jgi:hypothetical protein